MHTNACSYRLTADASVQLLRFSDGRVGLPHARSRVAGVLEVPNRDADDREALLDRASLISVPQTLPDRYAPQFLERTRRLHDEFWESRAGPGRPL